MKLPFFNAAFALSALLFVCGCATITTRTESYVEVRYNPLANSFSFVKKDAPPFFATDIVGALKRAKVPPESEVRVTMGKLDNQQLIADIGTRLLNGGYQHFTFCTAETAGSYKVVP